MASRLHFHNCSSPAKDTKVFLPIPAEDKNIPPHPAQIPVRIKSLLLSFNAIQYSLKIDGSEQQRPEQRYDNSLKKGANHILQNPKRQNMSIFAMPVCCFIASGFYGRGKSGQLRTLHFRKGDTREGMKTEQKTTVCIFGR